MSEPDMPPRKSSRNIQQSSPQNTQQSSPRNIQRSSPRSIGTERESSLHRALKFRYAVSEDRTEALMGNYVCDGISDTGEIIEVQTGSFGPLKRKAPELAQMGKVRIVHPIIITKYIELTDAPGNILHRRKSPRKGSLWDLFKALIYAPELPRVQNITIELVLVDLVESRVQDGRGSWRRKGVSIADKRLENYLGSVLLSALRDYYQFIPFKKGEEFTVRDLGERAKIAPALAGKALYVLNKLEIVEKLYRKGNAQVYGIKTGAKKPAKTGRKAPDTTARKTSDKQKKGPEK
ncbi:hypothetical protein FACS189493_6320 [Spirochaetia bacterium]|nr:hypothetical protein FACS189493_6320 [Spirochaetia bacterium]